MLLFQSGSCDVVFGVHSAAFGPFWPCMEYVRSLHGVSVNQSVSQPARPISGLRKKAYGFFTDLGKKGYMTAHGITPHAAARSHPHPHKNWYLRVSPTECQSQIPKNNLFCWPWLGLGSGPEGPPN